MFLNSHCNQLWEGENISFESEYLPEQNHIHAFG